MSVLTILNVKFGTIDCIPNVVGLTPLLVYSTYFLLQNGTLYPLCNNSPFSLPFSPWQQPFCFLLQILQALHRSIIMQNVYSVTISLHVP